MKTAPLPNKISDYDCYDCTYLCIHTYCGDIITDLIPSESWRGKKTMIVRGGEAFCKIPHIISLLFHIFTSSDSHRDQ